MANVVYYRVLRRILVCSLQTVLEAGEPRPDLFEDLVELDILVVVGVEVFLVQSTLLRVGDRTIVPENANRIISYAIGAYLN